MKSLQYGPERLFLVAIDITVTVSCPMNGSSDVAF